MSARDLSRRTAGLAGALLLSGSILVPVHAAQAAVHALVIGINDYVGPPKLRGAVNDAEDVSAVLRQNGVDVTVLTDRQATRENVFAKWQSMVKESGPGDFLIFHFAGHGIQEESTRGEAGAQESFLLADYDDVENPSDRLIDQELGLWLSLAADAGRTVLFVGDACHSGSPTRSIFGETLPTRFYVPRTQPERPRPLVQASAQVVDAARQSIFSVGATLANRTIPEIMIDNAPRGALSYAVARAYEGSADLDGDDVVSASEFEAFVAQTVRSLAASKQTPQFEIPDASFPILKLDRQIEVVPAAPQGAIQVHIRAGADEQFRASIAAIQNVSLTGDESGAQLVFDPSTGTLANNVRDVVARDLDLEGLKTAIEADRALKELQRLGLEGTLPIAFSPDDGVQPEGTKIGFTVPSVGGSYLTVFDLTATGSVHFLWPVSQDDADPLPKDQAFSLDTMVTPPFGADNLVVLAMDAPPAELRAELKKLDGTRNPAALIASLKAAVADRPYRIALQAFFTRPK